MDGEDPKIIKLLSLSDEFDTFNGEIKEYHKDAMNLTNAYISKSLKLSGLVIILLLSSSIIKYENLLILDVISIFIFIVLFVILSLNRYNYIVKFMLNEKESGYLSLPSDIIKEKVKIQIIKFAFVRILSFILIYFLLQISPELWWLIFSISSIIFILLFHKKLFQHELFTPQIEEFQDIELKNKINRFCGYMIERSNILRWKISPHSKRVDVAVRMINKRKCMLISENIFHQFRDDEINMLVLNVLGQSKFKHPEKQALFKIISAMILLGITNLLLDALIGFSDSYSKNSVLSVLFIYVTWLILVQFEIALNLAYSRFHMKKADKWALKQFPYIQVFESAITRISLINGAYPHNNKIEKLRYYSLPPIEEGINNLKSVADNSIVMN